MYIYSTCLPTERCIGMSNPSHIASNQLKHSLCRQSIVYFFAHLYHLLGLSKNFCPVALRHTYAPSMLHASPTSFNCTRSCHSSRRHHQQKQQLHNSQHKSCQSKTVAKNCYKAINKMVCTTFFFLSVSFVLFCCCCFCCCCLQCKITQHFCV